MGTPLIEKRAISTWASRRVRSGPSVMGSRIMPLSERLTRSTSWACWSMVRFLWMIPIPPSLAMAIAMRDSVTVSMAAVSSGIWSGMLGVRNDWTSVSLGWTVECPGTSRTSSKVRASPMMAFRRPAGWLMVSLVSRDLCKTPATQRVRASGHGRKRSFHGPSYPSPRRGVNPGIPPPPRGRGADDPPPVRRVPFGPPPPRSRRDRS